ncbi:DUF389 domain-containing protein [uncultured Psychrobacter sp.]|uniref:DUF389 domain-containing protein n=1 Tax=uncultured Psychrobacter sp. TaxID=259303 RepID=UPI00262E21AE|nr:DUF389 domain-containing protein [uncultured Psychrobacter sp.]
MTSSINDSSEPSPSKKNVSDFKDSTEKNSTEATKTKQPYPLDSDNLVKDDRQPLGKIKAEAKHPDPEITMTSPSPDVVIASVENVSPETATATAQADDKDNNGHLTNKTEETSSSQTSPTIPAEPNNNSSPPALNSALNDGVDSDVDSHTGEDEDKKSHTDTEDHLTDDDKVDEVKEEKEEKLESYKQFIAEQFSNQKVDYPKVRLTIEANALPSKMYFIMNTLSAIIASYGLITNSAAVVIGAMLVAMVLGPITGTALAIIDYRMPLLRRTLFTVIAGVSLVILVGFIVGYIHQGQPLSSEILSRTQPTSMDLMIALAGGTAGAYAMVSPHLSVAVVGVAVATALVPPLAASGILFANGETTLGFGAALLALTNIIAIQFTNAMVLWFLGFRRLVDDDYKSSTYLTFFRRNAIALLLLVGLGIYLTINLNVSAKQQAFENNVKDAINSHFMDKGNVLTNTQFVKVDGYQTVRAVIRGENSPTSSDVQKIEAVITQDMADNFPNYLPIKLQLRYLPVKIIESDPLIQNQLDETDAAILTK